MLKFEITSGKIHITDPCYDTKTWCGIYDQTAKKGAWIGDVTKDGSTIMELIVHHEDHLPTGEWSVLPGEVGVDSGQAGVFDAKIYPKGENNGEADNSKTFYGRCCRETCDCFDKEHQEKKRELGLESGYGVVDGHGFVSRTAYGDGGYRAYAQYGDGVVVAVKIVYDSDEEEEANYCIQCGNVEVECDGDICNECERENYEEEEND